MPRKFEGDTIVIASHNQGKIHEITSLLEPFHIKVLSASQLNLPEPEETGTTYLENALIKARACCEATSLPSLGDDSGIEVEALNGLPGLDTAPFTKQHGGRERVFAMWQANEKILENPKAAFICVQVLVWPDGHYEYFFGSVSGRLTFPPRGSGGHGYDPVFIPDGHTRTVAEMSFHEKNECSHRFLAISKLLNGCIKP